MATYNRRSWVKSLPLLGVVWLVGAIGDRLWFAVDQSVPTWDQADYLTGALNYWQALQTAQPFSADWWTGLWLLSSKVPPLVYLSTTPFIGLLGGGMDQSTLVNLLYSAILLGSVYALGVCLFSPLVGLWAAGITLLMPGLYRVRLDYLLDFPLAAMVMLCFACLTLWQQAEGNRSGGESDAPQQITALQRRQQTSFDRLQGWLTEIDSSWWWAIAVGVSLGLALMVKQTALLFLIVPFVWVTVGAIWQRQWRQLVQLSLAGSISLFIFLPWYRTNWLLMLSGSKRATIDSAIAEGDPSLLSPDAWTFYLRVLPGMVSLPLLLVGLLGLVFFWRRSRVSSQGTGGEDYAPKTHAYREKTYQASRRSIGWLLLFWGGSYFLSSLNVNKDIRYVVPYLPVVALILAYGFTLLPKPWKLLRWGTIGLSLALMLYNLFPMGSSRLHSAIAYHPVYRGAQYPHPEVINEVITAEPHLRSTIGVLPSTPEVNQHNINYFGNLRDFQVYGRQVGTRQQHIGQDGRSLSWFITKTGSQGSIRKADTQQALTQQVEQGGDFRLQRQWQLADGSELKLWHQRLPPVEVMEWGKAPQDSQQKAVGKPTGVTLEQVILPDRSPPGQPIPVTYRWSGEWESLRSGLVILTWKRQGAPTAQGTDRWLHDHAIGLGNLYAAGSKPQSVYQIVERTAMLPPTNLTPGTYRLEAVYLNPTTGKSQAIAAPTVTLQIAPNAPKTAAPELDLVTQVRSLGAQLPQGSKALDRIFDEVGRIGQYDPTQSYLEQTRQAMEYRLQQEPNNLDFLYALALSHVLQRQVNPAIATLEKITQVDATNPAAFAYLAFVNLYDFRPGAAQIALDKALKLSPELPELHALKGVAALMQFRPSQAWQQARIYQQLAGK